MSLILGTRPDRLNPSDERGLVYDDAVRQRTEALYPLVRDLVTPMEWPALAPLIDGVRRLKAERGAVILAHNYMTPDIFRLIGDFRGDSLQLAMEAAATDANLRLVAVRREAAFISWRRRQRFCPRRRQF